MIRKERKRKRKRRFISGLIESERENENEK